jgi:hypothetical protein
MADKKISALTSATTPLAGTEVLPIVQASTTVKVAVSDLTAGRAISATQLTLTTGNLIVANGQGVDFSATPGTGTSELFNDYEEGTWTPVISATGGAITSYTTTNTRYTKIGRQVTVNGTFGITNNGTGVGAVTISGVPYAILSGIAGGVAREAAVNGLMSMIVAGSTAQLNMTLYNNLYPGVTGGSYTFTATYFV